MINSDSFKNDWLEEKRLEYKCDKILLEKTIKALRLLEILINSGANLIFKGGTSLLLALNSFKRLSIDIDVIVDPESDIEIILIQ